MKLSNQVRSISHLKAHAAEIIRELGNGSAPLVISQNGEAKAVLQDIGDYERTQETLSLLKILALGQQQIARNELVPAQEAIAKLREAKDAAR